MDWTLGRVFKVCIIAGVGGRSIESLVVSLRLVAAELLAYETWNGKGCGSDRQECLRWGPPPGFCISVHSKDT